MPEYMVQRSDTGPEHGILVVRGDLESGLRYSVRRDDGVTLGEDEVLALAGADDEATRAVGALVSRPTPDVVDRLAGLGRRVRPAGRTRGRRHRGHPRRGVRPGAGQLGHRQPGLAGEPRSRPRRGRRSRLPAAAAVAARRRAWGSSWCWCSRHPPSGSGGSDEHPRPGARPASAAPHGRGSTSPRWRRSCVPLLALLAAYGVSTGTDPRPADAADRDAAVELEHRVPRRRRHRVRHHHRRRPRPGRGACRCRDAGGRPRPGRRRRGPPRRPCRRGDRRGRAGARTRRRPLLLAAGQLRLPPARLRALVHRRRRGRQAPLVPAARQPRRGARRRRRGGARRATAWSTPRGCAASPCGAGSRAASTCPTRAAAARRARAPRHRRARPDRGQRPRHLPRPRPRPHRRRRPRLPGGARPAQPAARPARRHRPAHPRDRQPRDHAGPSLPPARHPRLDLRAGRVRRHRRCRPASTVQVRLSDMLRKAGSGDEQPLGLLVESTVAATADLAMFVQGDLVTAVPVAPLTGPGTAVLPEGGGRLVLGGATGQGVVTATFRDADGTEVGEERVEVAAGRATPVAVPRAARLVTVTPRADPDHRRRPRHRGRRRDPRAGARTGADGPRARGHAGPPVAPPRWWSRRSVTTVSRPAGQPWWSRRSVTTVSRPPQPGRPPTTAASPWSVPVTVAMAAAGLLDPHGVGPLSCGGLVTAVAGLLDPHGVSPFVPAVVS